MGVKVGDVVARKSYKKDVLFKVCEIVKNSEKGDVAVIKGICMRVLADAPVSDLEIVPVKEVEELFTRNQARIKRCEKETAEQRKEQVLSKNLNAFRSKEKVKNFGRLAKVVHLDGDKEYLEICLEAYEKMGLEVIGKYLKESDQPSNIYNMLKEYSPDILVLTGHDGISKSDTKDGKKYRNSGFFINAVKQARRFNPSLDDLVIFAGACQSNYEALLEAGANFASSPQRVLIHLLDPVLVVQKIAFGSIDSIVPIRDVITNTITGITGIGGFQTRGKYRKGLPKSLYEE